LTIPARKTKSQNVKAIQTLSELEIIGALAIFVLQKTGSVYGTFEGRISAQEQRAAFGCVPFGKCKVQINGEKEIVSAYRKVAFGQDWESASYSWMDFEKVCRANRHPFELGRCNAKYSTLPL
jgi:hypothetical protein